MGDVILTSDLPIKQPEKVKIQDLIKNNRHLYEVLPNNSWKDRSCFIVGGGPSLKNFDFSILKGELTIGINRAFEKFDPTILFSMDSRFWGWVERGKLGEEAKTKFQEYKGFKVWLNVIKFPYPEDIYIVDSAGQRELTFSMKDGIGHGNNSGYAALNLALCLGANPIYLLGFDMKGEKNKQSWWHNGYPVVQQGNVYRDFRTNFEWAAPKIKEAGFKVINLNPESALKCFEFGKFNGIKFTNHPIFISFYTKNTGYEQEIQNLISSFKKFKLEHEIETIESLGDWQKNVKYKAVLMRKMLDKYPHKNIVYLDSDSIICRYPSLFENIDADIAVHYIDWSKYRGPDCLQLNGAVVYVANNQKTRELLDTWIKRNDANPSMTDQKILEELLEQRKDEVKIYNLPPEYCKIFDTMRQVEDPVIEQFQASRRFRQEINKTSSVMELEENEKKKYEDAWRRGAETASVNSRRVVNYVKQLDKQWTMIDLGCGNGAAVKSLRGLGFNIVGIDITLEAVGKDKKGFFEGPLWRLPFKDNEFDFTFSTDVLEHIPPRLVDRVIKEIYRITKVKTFHAIAPFEHCNQGFVFHLTTKPIKWWKAQFDRLKNKDIEVEVMHRSDLSRFGG